MGMEEKLLNHYEEKIRKLEKQLEEAIEVIEFYADTTSWDSKDGLNDTYIDGVITYSDVYAPWDDAGISVGGKLANQFLEKLKEKND